MTRIEASTEEFIGAVADAEAMLASTYGPFGLHVSAAGYNASQSFDDGFAAMSLLSDVSPVRNEAYRRVLAAGQAQVRAVGDGSTTAMLLTCELLRRGMRKGGSIAKGQHDLVNDLRAAKDRAINALSEMTINPGYDEAGRKVLRDVSTIAVHGNREMGNLIGDLVFDLGPSGLIRAEASLDGQLSVSSAAGYVWERGVPDPVFFTGNGRMDYENPLIVLVYEELVDINDKFFKLLFQAWEQECKKQDRHIPLVLVCSKVKGSVMSTFQGAAKDGKPLALVSVAGGDQDGDLFMRDLAAVTGATLMDGMRGSMLHKFTAECFGRAARITSTATNTSVQLLERLGGLSIEDVLIARENQILTEYSHGDVLHDAGAQDQRKRRIAALRGATGIIRVPMVTETGFASIKEQIEDGYFAAREAFNGVVPGGGASFRYLSEIKGISGTLLGDALASLWDVLLISSGLKSGPSITPGTAFNLVTTEFGNCVEIGLVDPVSVLKSAITVSVDAAIPLILSGHLLVKS